jgi:prevent-host-death family protein
MKSIKAGEFKAKCLNLMDEVAASGEPMTITKHGRPVAMLTPARSSPKALFGALRGHVAIKGDMVAPLEAERDGQT